MIEFYFANIHDAKCTDKNRVYYKLHVYFCYVIKNMFIEDRLFNESLQCFDINKCVEKDFYKHDDILGLSSIFIL